LAHAASLRHTSFFARPKSVRFLHSFNRKVRHPAGLLCSTRREAATNCALTSGMMIEPGLLRL
jgi:hypothetical protein